MHSHAACTIVLLYYCDILKIMFLCGNCTTGEDDKKFETIVGTVGVDRSSKVLQHIMAQQTCETAVRQIMLCPSKYKLHLAECERTGKPFTDPDFPPNADSLNYASGREIAWKRISEIMPDFKMVEKGIVPADIQQGNIGDCYFLASLAALAEDPSRIVAIFHEDFEESKYGLYKVLVNREGVPTELVIDDYIPVYKTTNRPVFCKANGNEIWVMLLEKVWAKVKGSYGAIKAGSPHEVLNTFSIAPCFNFSIHEALEEADHDKAWESLREAARRNYPMCAGSNDHVGLAGLKPNHTYTLLHCEDVRSNNKSYRILRLRNPWGKTEYKGFASEYDEDFWADVPKEVQAKILPKKESNDGDFTIPIEAFVQNFESIDISHIRNAFSYEFKKLWMQSNQPTFVRLRVEQAHEAYISFEKGFKNVKGDQEINYGYTRMMIAYEPSPGQYEFYEGCLETSFPDLTHRGNFKTGNYFIMLQADDPMEGGAFSATFSYYHKSHGEVNLKDIEVEHNVSKNKELTFIEAIVLNHAHHNEEKTKLSPRNGDWVKSALLSDEGGYGYVVCSLQEDSDVRVTITLEQEQLKKNGFVLKGNYGKGDTEVDVQAGETVTVVFSYDFSGEFGMQAENVTFPPPGFRLTKKV